MSEETDSFCAICGDPIKTATVNCHTTCLAVILEQAKDEGVEIDFEDDKSEHIKKEQE